MLNVLIGKLLTVNDERILGVPLLSRFGEVERPRDYGISTNHHNLVVGYGVLAIYLYRYTSVGEKSG